VHDETQGFSGGYTRQARRARQGSKTQREGALRNRAQGCGCSLAESEGEAMSIYKRADSGLYWYRFEFGGRLYQGSTKMRNRKAAERIEAVIKTRLAEGRVGILERKPAPLLREYLPHFLEVVALGCKPRTGRFYKKHLARSLAVFGSHGLDAIGAESIRALRDDRLREGRAGRTVNCDLSALRRLFSVAVKEGVLESSPFAGRRVEFCPENRRERILSYTEEGRYLAVVNPLLHDVAVVMLEMGLRPSEVFQVHSRDVNLFHSPPYVHVPDSKTVNGRRDVSITSRALAVISARLSRARGGYLFPWRHGNGKPHYDSAVTDVHKAHERALAASKIDPSFRLYDLRHTYGTRAAEAGVDPLTLARLMGHADLKTTQRYVHLSKRHLAEAQARIERFRTEQAALEVEMQKQAEASKAVQ